MQNPGLLIISLLCGVPALITLVIIFLVRSLAKRRITMNVERTSIPLPDVRPDTRRLAIYFDLEERKPPEIRKEEEE